MTALTFFQSVNFFLIDSGQSRVMIGQSKAPAADLDWFGMSATLGRRFCRGAGPDFVRAALCDQQI
jgi:hypothetical protein